jgi:bidirectional [NiFe] hydrogenase diaphorase subunit
LGHITHMFVRRDAEEGVRSPLRCCGSKDCVLLDFRLFWGWWNVNCLVYIEVKLLVWEEAMPLAPKRPSQPSDDKRWKIVDATMRRHGYAPDALIETLHTVQECFGFLEKDALKYVAGSLRVALSRVYGAATFYHFFTLKPPGRHTCVICTGTACYIKGAPALLSELEKRFKLKPGQTTEDGSLSLLTARCVGSCSLAPAAVLDRDVVGKLGPSEIISKAQEVIRS